MKDWRSILSHDNASDSVVRRFRVLEKRGHFFLYLPTAPRVAARTLQLYSAQRLSARVIRTTISMLLWLRLPLPVRTVDVPISNSSPFGNFLRRLVLGKDDELPTFGVLSNYNQQEERRCIILLFDAIDHPRAVVKVGQTPEARNRIRRERDFFLPAPVAMPGLPTLIYTYSEADAEAIAYQYVEGRNLLNHETSQLTNVLSDWVWRDRTCILSELDKFKELESLRESEPLLDPFIDVLAGTKVHPVLSHGDFVPWNIRVTNEGKWRVLDWERARRADIPAWDWFHFVVAYHLGVLDSPLKEIADSIEAIWADPQFQKYARLTGIQDVFKEHTIAYLLYSHHLAGLERGRLRLTALEIIRRHFPDSVRQDSVVSSEPTSVANS